MTLVIVAFAGAFIGAGGMLLLLELAFMSAFRR